MGLNVHTFLQLKRQQGGCANEWAIHQIELIQSRHWHSDSSYHSVFSSSELSLPSVLDKSRITPRQSTNEQLLMMPKSTSKIKATCHECMILHGIKCTHVFAIETSTRWMCKRMGHASDRANTESSLAFRLFLSFCVLII